ncbi:MAG TPA: methylenetetrahydrofolate--tRNA-(uracil(54)-C(5))-methyltransferase (FADH(2)-oxidizing) TrmFO [Bacillota bacterium]|jgi:methylenetetrahydrofolate--tRNA-(uracil-5-)-methyltransferase|nr:methylenetetrahydrofolate--tRNA-(uracil(54)-C(5))-methyltransferase (FADH(2)-oxidizing) TrmFO [Bacillota bacterium]HOB87726.1 methylenetetrahydrofolate--tRNA-(uracil(54)-C(5))-methyltransferase (FADH(2)-oxidizing) TrmFO [Bacillota bacterium]HOP68657.1 methylenetetrahydrofolate--tRNA-(uracil(54)-C(5))-methyltransferase (FADH(2)-oxidizing) TrmFO [Bacillota bacterium]HPT34220.1 methylenetetrahydrofolate--tRNA-(uracil(54)-C(5))-methyltransferase (FADH(2)-oxidizing) TrmFO [Bacillota bacterium]HPZ
MSDLLIIGAGLAGSEAAWQAARCGLSVELVEMRPEKSTPAHHTGLFAELVCSNSLRAAALTNAVGLLKEEMRRLDSLIIDAAYRHRLPAGGALAVDRQAFSREITERLKSLPQVTVTVAEATEIPRQRPAIVATGPLTSPALAEAIRALTGEEYLYFYDAAAPIVTAESIDESKTFLASRYGKGSDDYINCPLNEEEYYRFWKELTEAQVHQGHEFEEKEKYFEGCMPVEELARRGRDTLRFGPMKPVGLVDPRTGQQPFAVVQLRRDNKEGTLYNLVGFQTRLKWSEQARVFRLIPGLERAEFVRYGVMHRNTYLNGPRLLDATFQLRDKPGLFFAGQISGVEGYVESAASGLVAGLNAAAWFKKHPPLVFPPETALGALGHYLETASPENFQPMNINFGLFPPVKQRGKQRKEALAKRALESLEQFELKIKGLLA